MTLTQPLHCLSPIAHEARSSSQESEHVQTVKGGQTQKHFICVLQRIQVPQVVKAEYLVWDKGNHHDEGEAQALELSAEILL